MRAIFTFAFIVLMPAVAFAAMDMPARKPGLWQVSIVMEGRGLPQQTAKHCIDAATDKQMNSMGSSMQKEACSKQDMQRVGNTIVVDSVCKFGNGTSTSHAVVSGDFNSAYTVKVDSKHEGGPSYPGAPAGGMSHMTIEAKWLGACEAGQQPGDMILGNGMKMNIKNLPAMPGMPAR